MSAAAAWSYTSKATLWPLLSRDDRSGSMTFGQPLPVACTYSTDSKRMVDAKGDEFTTRLVLFTEFATAKQGDRVALGTVASNDPIAAGALEVRDVMRQADVFDGVADDFQIATG